jgi:hypothetical protein
VKKGKIMGWPADKIHMKEVGRQLFYSLTDVQFFEKAKNQTSELIYF